jgi:hypothetical protein
MIISQQERIKPWESIGSVITTWMEFRIDHPPHQRLAVVMRLGKM